MTTPYARFGTLLGAVVELLPTADARYFRWRCLGCHETTAGNLGQAEAHARSQANVHAAECRALPQPE